MGAGDFGAQADYPVHQMLEVAGVDLEGHSVAFAHIEWAVDVWWVVVVSRFCRIVDLCVGGVGPGIDVQCLQSRDLDDCCLFARSVRRYAPFTYKGDM